MTTYRIIAVILMLVPIAMMLVGLKRFRTRPGDTLGLALAAAGDFLLFILGWIASGQFLYALMVSMALVIFYCRKLCSSGVAGAYAIGFLASGIAVGAAMISVSVQSAGCAAKEARFTVQERGNIVEEARAELIGKTLGDVLEGRRALVIIHDYTGKLTRRFRRGVGSGFDIIDIARQLPPGPRQSEERWEWGESKTLAKQFDELLDGRDDYDVVISFMDLPMRPEDMQFWKRPAETRPDFVLVQRSLAGKTSLLQKGWLSGIVTDLPTTDDETNKWLDDPNSKYTIKKLVAALAGTVAYVDQDNLAEITKKYPSLLN